MTHVSPGLILLFIFLPMVFSLFTVVYLAHAYTKRIESLLSRSQFVQHHRDTFSGLGIIGEVIRTGFIVFVLMMPELMARRGAVDVDQVKSFPTALKWILVGAWSVLFLSAVALIVFVPTS